MSTHTTGDGMAAENCEHVLERVYEGTPIGTVMSRLNRGRTQLRSLLSEYAQQRGLLRREGSRA